MRCKSNETSSCLTSAVLTGVRSKEFSFLRRRIPTAGHCFIIDAEGAQFHSQTVLHVLAHFLAFSTHGPLAHFKPIQTSYIFLLLFLKNLDKEPSIEKYKRDAKCKVVKLTEIAYIPM